MQLPEGERDVAGAEGEAERRAVSGPAISRQVYLLVASVETRREMKVPVKAVGETGSAASESTFHAAKPSGYSHFAGLGTDSTAE